MAYCIGCIGSKQYDYIILYGTAWYALRHASPSTIPVAESESLTL